MNKFIYITGCDGTGKSTQARLLIDQLRSQGVKTQHVWLRFPFLFSIPLLAYARLRGFSWYENTAGVRHGYWNFRHSRLLRNWLPWTILIDATLTAVYKIYFPLLQEKTVVCERFVFDMLVDLAVGNDDPDLHRWLPGKLFFHLIPCDAKIILFDLDSEVIRERRADLKFDRLLETRLSMFRCLALDSFLTISSDNKSVNEINKIILKELDFNNELTVK